MTEATIEFSPELHRDFIQRRGEQIGWLRSAICACRDPVAGTHDRSCSVCGGEGFVYAAQDVADYRALIRQVDERQEFAKFGQIYLGDITITTMPDEIPVGEGDLVDLADRQFRRQEALNCDGEQQMSLAWAPAIELLSVRSLDGDYQIGTDVRLASGGGGLYWIDSPPAAGTRISVLYNWTPRYLVVPSMVMSRRVVDGTAMPQRVVARLKNREDFRQ